VEVAMLVRCEKAFRHQISKGNIYLVIEIIIKRANSKISYRIIDNDGCPAIYDSENFKIVSENVNGMCILTNDIQISFTHKRIIDSKLQNENIDGFWGAYIEDSIEAKDILQLVVEDLATYEKVAVPNLL
jgi:hypothetical protein